jgi:hypothetical protein
VIPHLARTAKTVGDLEAAMRSSAGNMRFADAKKVGEH